MTGEALIVVYQVTNRVNGKRYIGITQKGLKARRGNHLGEARRGKKSRFYNAIRKYGEDAFDFVVLKVCLSFDEAKAEEVAVIADLQPEYNTTKGGDGALGLKHTLESKEKMRLAKVGVPGNWTGKKRPDIVEGARQRLLAKPLRYWLGKKRSPETAAKISATKKGVRIDNPSQKQLDAWRARSQLL